MSVKDYKSMYMVVILGDKLLGDDLEDCNKLTCTNKRALATATGISYYRLVYVFAKRGRSYLVEHGMLILKSTILYKGSQPGGIRNLNLLNKTGY